MPHRSRENYRQGCSIGLDLMEVAGREGLLVDAPLEASFRSLLFRLE